MAETYEIRVKGRINLNWRDWFDRLAVSQMGQETVLCGPVEDQAELYGILTTMRDLGLELVSLQQVKNIHAPQGGKDE